MAAPRKDAVLAAAVDIAADVLAEFTDPGTVGGHIGMEMTAERLATHFFECTMPGYRGWSWAVTVARAPRARNATVCETNLVPGPDALLSPVWVPYADRLAPGDLSPGDVTPYVADDPRLEAGWEATGDEDVDALANWELGLGRERVLSAEGRDDAAQRWYDGENGPSSETARRAQRPCATCGFMIPMPGALRSVFGVCANKWSDSDGRVVALAHGCGAHSEVDVRQPEPEPIDQPVLDEYALEVV